MSNPSLWCKILFSPYYNKYFFFPQDFYGDRIKIFRSVGEKGGGVYRLKNEHGKVVRDKRVKEELSRILLCYNIQLDNPVSNIFKKKSRENDVWQTFNRIEVYQ